MIYIVKNYSVFPIPVDLKDICCLAFLAIISSLLVPYELVIIVLPSHFISISLEGKICMKYLNDSIFPNFPNLLKIIKNYWGIEVHIRCYNIISNISFFVKHTIL